MITCPPMIAYRPIYVAYILQNKKTFNIKKLDYNVPLK